jgi:hypothetical protein
MSVYTVHYSRILLKNSGANRIEHHGRIRADAARRKINILRDAEIS